MLRPQYLRRKAKEFLMEHPNAIWNNLSTHLIKRRNLCSLSWLHEWRRIEQGSNGLYGTRYKKSTNWAERSHNKRCRRKLENDCPIQKGKQNAKMFCGFCRTNGHTPSFCRKKIRDEEVKKLQSDVTAEKKFTFTQDYKKRRGPALGSWNWTGRDGDDEIRRSLAYTKQLS